MRSYMMRWKHIQLKSRTHQSRTLQQHPSLSDIPPQFQEKTTHCFLLYTQNHLPAVFTKRSRTSARIHLTQRCPLVERLPFLKLYTTHLSCKKRIYQVGSPITTAAAVLLCDDLELVCACRSGPLIVGVSDVCCCRKKFIAIILQ